jgi:hypothetical protein
MGAGVGAGVGVALAVTLGVAVGVGVGTAVGVGLGTTEGDGDGEVVSMGDAVAATVGDAVAAGVGEDALFCGSGTSRITKSSRLSSLSKPEPETPPGSRSRLAPADGAGAGVPTSHVFAALPQPTASIAAAAPTILSATLPPVAASPLA